MTKEHHRSLWQYPVEDSRDIMNAQLIVEQIVQDMFQYLCSKVVHKIRQRKILKSSTASCTQEQSKWGLKRESKSTKCLSSITHQNEVKYREIRAD